MIYYKLVLPEFLNDQGSLFGGYLLKWIDEYAYVTASLLFPGNKFVTIALDDVVFKHAISMGEILGFEVEQSRIGNSSVQFAVKVRGERDVDGEKTVYFETHITFVNIDEHGNNQPIKRPPD